MFTYEAYARIRDARGLRDAAVARGAGVTRSTFTEWKADRSHPKSDKLIRISDFLGCSLKALETGDLSVDPVLPDVQISASELPQLSTFSDVLKASDLPMRERRMLMFYYGLSQTDREMVAGLVEYLATRKDEDADE